MKAYIYNCKTSTEATDRANIFYINASSARHIQKDHAEKEIKILNARRVILAVFRY